MYVFYVFMFLSEAELIFSSIAYLFYLFYGTWGGLEIERADIGTG